MGSQSSVLWVSKVIQAFKGALGQQQQGLSQASDLWSADPVRMVRMRGKNVEHRDCPRYAENIYQVNDVDAVQGVFWWQIVCLSRKAST